MVVKEKVFILAALESEPHSCAKRGEPEGKRGFRELWWGETKAKHGFPL